MLNHIHSIERMLELDEKCLLQQLDEREQALVPELKDCDRLLELTKGTVEFFHSAAGQAFAATCGTPGARTLPVGSDDFKRWLSRRFFEATGRAPSSQAFVNALRVLLGRALFDSPQREIYLRTAEQNGVMYLDLGN